MEWPVEMDLGHGCHMDVFLSIRSNAGEIFLDYTDVTKEQIILDKLSSFNRIEFDENNPLHITFKGPNSTRSFKFKDEDAVSNVWSYLQNFVRFDSIVGKCRAYYIVPLDQKPTIMESAKTLIESIFSRKPSHSPKDLDISPPEAIISNIVHESLSDLHIVELNENNYDEFFDVDGTFKEDVCMSNIEIKFDYSFNLWKRILNINPTEEDSEDYLRLLKQWNPVFENQWKHNFRLRQFVFSLENDLKDSHLPPDLRKLTFEILMSYYYQRLGKFDYNISMYRIVSFLIDTSIIIESNNEENLFYLKDGGLSDRKSISVEIFYMFSELYDRYFDPNGSKYVFCDEQQITTGVNEILKEHSPSTLQLLQSFKINHYDFVFPFVRSFFISGRIPTDGEYLFTAFIASKDPIKHAQCMIATSFILLHGRLSSIPLNQIDMFKEIYMALMMKLEVRLLLNNSDVLEKTIEEVELDDDNNDED